MHPALGCASLSVCVLGNSVSKAVRRELCKRILVLFSDGEASIHTGTLYPSSSLSGNLSPCYLINVTYSVLVRPQQPCLLNSSFQVARELSFCTTAASVAVLNEQILFVLPMTPIQTKTQLASPRIVFYSADSTWSVFRVVTIFSMFF